MKLGTWADATAEVAKNAEIQYLLLRALGVLGGKISNGYTPRQNGKIVGVVSHPRI